MRKLIFGSLFAATFGTALAIVSALPASAQLARPDSIIDVSDGNNLLTTVQYRGRGVYRGGYRGVYRGGYGVYRGGYRGRYYGPGVGIGLGLMTGAIIGGALAAPYYGSGYYGPDYYGAGYYAPAPRVYYGAPVAGGVAYCMRRYKSYDPASGTYLGYDGFRHACP